MWKFHKIVWNQHHAQLPTPIFIGDSTIRLYYSTKIDGRSHIYFIDLSENNFEPLSQPVEALGPGSRGCFDDAGVMPSCIVNGYMYYTGWNLRRDVPYSHAIGMAEIRKDGKIERIDCGPILNVNRYDSYLVNSPCVIEDSGTWVMYYSSGTGWYGDYPSYCIKKATSLNGKSWLVSQDKEITFEIEDEAISRVCHDPKKNVLYFAMKTKSTNYRIYCRDESNNLNYIDIDNGEWDSKMQCYPFVYDNDGLRYFFYNGNGYGETGIGVAKWIEGIV